MSYTYKYNNITSLANSLSYYNFYDNSNDDNSNYNIELKIYINEFNYYSIKATYINNTIFSLNFDIKDDKIKIEYLNINNDYYSNKFNEKIFLTINEYKLLKEAIFNYIEKIAYKNNKRRIIIYIHNNLERYNYELLDIGFIITNRRCFDNPFWIEAEKILKNDYIIYENNNKYE